MSTDPGIGRLRELGLLPHQANFITSIMSARRPTRVILSAPVGMGKSTAVAGLIAEFLAVDPNSRCAVVVTSKVVSEQVAATIGRWVDKSLVIQVSARSLRELLGAAQDSAGDTLPRPGVTIWNLSALRATGLVRNAWAAFRPELVIVDEAERLMTGWEATLGRAGSSAQVVVLTAFTPVAELRATLQSVEGWDFMEWSAPLQTWHGDWLATGRLVSRKAVEYRRSDAELSILRGVQNLYGALSSADPAGRVAYLAGSSSLFALENLLLRRLSVLAGGEDAFANLGDEESHRSDTLLVPLGSRLPASEEFSRLQEILEAIGAIERDSKAVAFVNLIRQLNDEGRIGRVVFARVARTLDLLAQLIGDAGLAAVALDGSMSIEARDEAVRQADRSHAVLLVTDAVLRGQDLGHVTQAIHYDLPINPIWMGLREARLGAFATAEQVETYALRDSSGAYPLEDQLLSQCGFYS